MYRKILAGLLVAGTTLGAQAPGGPGAPPGQGRGGDAPAAEMLLANTGRLQLTDQQVLRLAAIARRGEARNEAMRARLDSAARRFQSPADSASRRAFAQNMRTQMEQMREQQFADRRDAIAVLTPDQQARAWEMVSQRGRGVRGQAMRGQQRGPGVRGRGMRHREPMAREPRGRAPRPGNPDR